MTWDNQKVNKMAEAKLVAIAIREKSRAKMTELEQAEITIESGVESDFRGKPGARQVTLLSHESWNDACQDLGKTIPWTTRRANLLVSGLQLEQTTDSIVRIGDVVLRVTGETDPCHRMDEQVAGLCKVLEANWRGGVCCRVVEGGAISVGDLVTLESHI